MSGEILASRAVLVRSCLRFLFVLDRPAYRCHHHDHLGRAIRRLIFLALLVLAFSGVDSRPPLRQF